MMIMIMMLDGGDFQYFYWWWWWWWWWECGVFSLSFSLVFYWRQRPPSCHIRWYCTKAKSTSVGCVWESEWSAIYYYDSLLRKRNQPAFHIIREKNKDTDFSFTCLTIPILSILSFFSQENEWRGRVRSKEKESMKLEKMTTEFPNSFYTHKHVACIQNIYYP